MKIKLGNKTITLRKWKGKDKKNFTRALRDEKIDQSTIINTLIYACIEEDVILNSEEIKYVLSRLRSMSLGDDVTIEFYCNECGTTFSREFKISEIIRYKYTDIREIKVKGVHITLGEIKNKDFYLKKIDEDPMYDFLLRIESFNGSDAFTLDSLESMIDDLDIDILTEIMGKFEASRFKIDDINTVECSCGHSEVYEFDELPGFLPDDWFGAQ